MAKATTYFNLSIGSFAEDARLKKWLELPHISVNLSNKLRGSDTQIGRLTLIISLPSNIFLLAADLTISTITLLWAQISSLFLQTRSPRSFLSQPGNLPSMLVSEVCQQKFPGFIVNLLILKFLKRAPCIAMALVLIVSMLENLYSQPAAERVSKFISDTGIPLSLTIVFISFPRKNRSI